MKKTMIILVLVFIPLMISFSQEKVQRFDYKFGIGSSLLGSGDMITAAFENELSYKINHYLSSSVNINYATSNTGSNVSTSLIQSNLNLFISPFGKSKNNIFRIGTGLSVMGVMDIYNNSHNRRTSYGYNLIIERDYQLSENFSIGYKLFTQQYRNRDVSSGILIKTGIKI